ncbi:uncharacterized protein LOC141854475 [Brevipalpus obovatus]|uniref:uncharacterized protein LOC141854475 n=1 Tax=Brevipalpus obovatus TaxID=246614 RepID=UPI003D9F63B2
MLHVKILSPSVILMAVNTLLLVYSVQVLCSTVNGREWTPVPIPLHPQGYSRYQYQHTQSQSNSPSIVKGHPLPPPSTQPLTSSISATLISSSSVPISTSSSSPIKSQTSSSSSSSPSAPPSSASQHLPPASPSGSNKKPIEQIHARLSTIKTKDRTYTVESTHFPTPIIEHHENGATVGLDLPDSNIRLLLDLDELGGRPMAQHIGLKVVEHGPDKMAKGSMMSASNSSGARLVSPADGSGSSIRVTSPASSQKHHHIHFNQLTADSQVNAIDSQSVGGRLIQIPVATNYKIGYVRTSDLHSAINQRLVSSSSSSSGNNGKYASRLAVNSKVKGLKNPQIKATIFPSNKHNSINMKAYMLAIPGNGLKSPAAALHSARNGRSQSSLLGSPVIDQGKFKPIERYSAKLDTKGKTNFDSNVNTTSQDEQQPPPQSVAGKTSFGSKNVGKTNVRSPVQNIGRRPGKTNIGFQMEFIDDTDQIKIDAINDGVDEQFVQQPRWPVKRPGRGNARPKSTASSSAKSFASSSSSSASSSASASSSPSFSSASSSSSSSAGDEPTPSSQSSSSASSSPASSSFSNNDQSNNLIQTNFGGDNSDVGFDDDAENGLSLSNNNNGNINNNNDDDNNNINKPTTTTTDGNNNNEFDDSDSVTITSEMDNIDPQRLTRSSETTSRASSSSSSSSLTTKFPNGRTQSQSQSQSRSSAEATTAALIDDPCGSRCAVTCATTTDQLLDDRPGSLMMIAQTLEADQLFKVLPSAGEALQSMMDFAANGYTLLLPNNEAIDRLPRALLSRWQDDIAEMTDMLENHFIDSPQSVEDMEFAGTIAPRATDSTLRMGKFRNQTYTINGRSITIGDQKGPNEGMIHVIDGILYPPANQNIMKVLKSCRKFDGFVTLSDGTGISEMLGQAGPFTVFVPSNEALQKIPDKDLQLIRNNITALRELLTYHVAKGAHFSNDLMDGQYIDSLLNNHQIQVGVRVDGCSRRLVEANMSPVFRADIPASNGVIHIVDWIIKPSDHDWCENVILARK